VGIGTNAPADILHTLKSAGTVHLDTTVAGQPFYLNFDDNGAGKWKIYKTTGNDLSFYDYQGTAGDRVFFQHASGNVGIGTSNPGSLLEIDSGAVGTVIATLKAKAGQTADLLDTYDGAGTKQVYIDSAGVLHGNGSGLTGLAGGTVSSVALSLPAQ